ncbi:MAG: PEP-CTERM sorting domain-containing protein, partial [Verrucomicrobiae bacterium]|nr:PEP-CTERM sorting domain-containing protein [Verrucomicrobiae bacterium]
NNELGGGPTSFTGGWDWNNANSDGGVIGPLSGPLWSLTVTPMTTTKGYSGGIAAYSSDGSSLPLAYGTGSDYAITITPVPEPGEYVAIVAAGLLGLASWRRWRRT